MVSLIRIALALASAATIALVGAGWARADDPTPEVCGAFNLGVPPEQIAGGLEQNDARYNYWRAHQSTVWPIIEGDCG